MEPQGTFSLLVRITLRRLNRALIPGTGRNAHSKENNMDAKLNWLIDNVAIRVTLNTVAFAIWIATAVALLELGARG
jgi:hypothetical protein